MDAEYLYRVLLVDDEKSMRRNISDLLGPLRYQIVEAANGVEALEKFEADAPQMVILDINLPGKNGLEVLEEMKKISPDVPVIVFTAFGTSERAMKAIRLGAFDYMEKPFELDEFILTVERACDYRKLLNEVKSLRNIVNESGSQKPADNIIGRSSKMQDIFKLIGRIAPTDATVLIYGESGTGKELIADAIQRHSLRAEEPYVKINCGALSESILESEIFGHEKGSFTGADSMRKGLFEIADGGTVYLDEINSMPLSLQIRLLRILQNQSFFRVGGVKPVKVDVRLIASTNRDLEPGKDDGNFRNDLYYRLSVVRINVPPLRERKEDINLLLDHFLSKYSPGRRLVPSDETYRMLHSYSWPGNIRELENTIHSAVVTTNDGVLTIEQLPMQTAAADAEDICLLDYIDKGLSFRETINLLERRLIEEALRLHNNNQTRAAEYLKMSRRLLYTKLKNNEKQI
ncbi:MAG: sigma-54 dependent transcriptional regulator [Marinilabiliaceae bacterium]|jgi:DNA-binding NtrC family response regulator|nr:sigma-54 dependent transcriptional regulator [Marinilabiliaceae bacterium]